MEFQPIVLVVVITYISLLVLWGIYQGRKVKTGSDFVIAAMISTADSLLILSATELSESILKKKNDGEALSPPSNTLRRHRLTTAALAVIALVLSRVSPSKLIFTIVSYVWAGIGCTFSVVILCRNRISC